MLLRGLLWVIAIAAFWMSFTPAQAFDDAKYPDLSGEWIRVNTRAGGQITFDQTKPWGRGQQAPLTGEYQAIHEASLADQASGGQGNWHSGDQCMPPGMPASMNGYNSMEFVVLPAVTYVLVEHNLPTHRRIYTDGRGWPSTVEPTFQGYSIGRWIDSEGTGRFDVLEAETRYFKGPRAIDPTGIPVHADNQSIVKERIYLDKANPGLLHDEITLIDHALTRPWTVLKGYLRSSAKFPSWPEQSRAWSGSVGNFISKAPTTISYQLVRISRRPISDISIMGGNDGNVGFHTWRACFLGPHHFFAHSHIFTTFTTAACAMSRLSL